MKTHQAIGLSLVLVASMGTSALAQPAMDPNDAQRAQDYQAQRDTYDAQRQTYDAQRNNYEDQRSTYDAQRRAYERRRAEYERRRADYDAQYGPGAYARYYGPEPVYEVAPGPDCRDREAGGAVVGGVLGALAGAVIGSNIGDRDDRGGGVVLGGLAGGAIGASVGAGSARCDDRGYYYAYDQTFPYREGPWEEGRASGRYDYGYYSAHHCRLAIARGHWRDRDEDRYVRVCPDGEGRYRLAD